MDELDPNDDWSDVFEAVAAASVTGFSAGHARPIEYFGGRAVDFDEAPLDNRAAFAAALDWTRDTGGAVMLGAGVYGVDGPVTLQSHANLVGLGKHQSVVRQMDPASDTFTTGTDPAARDTRVYCQFRDFCIHGGWTENWSEDASGHAAAAIRLDGHVDGSSDPRVLDRTRAGSVTDSRHVIQGMYIRNVRGTGIVLDGRGETLVAHTHIFKCSRVGILCAAYDNFFVCNSVAFCGDTCFRLTASNQRIVGDKYWFAGVGQAEEHLGAGLHMVGGDWLFGVIVQGVGIQDTWGPGLIASGAEPIIDVSLDNCGGGRVDARPFWGYKGKRSFWRSFLRLDDLRHARIRASISGGAPFYPKLVDIGHAGCEFNRVECTTQTGRLDTDPVYILPTVTEAQRYNRVTLNDETLVGKLTLAELADARHGINAPGYRPERVPLTDGRIAIRRGSDWGIVAPSSFVTPS